MLSAIQRVKNVLEVSIKKVNEILEGEIGKEKAEVVEAPVHAEYVTSEEEEEATETAETEAKEGTPPEPKATKPRPVGRRGRNGEVNKSDLIRDYFKSHPNARNQEVIDHVKEKHNIELQPSLVSTVKIAMNIPKSKQGRIKGKKSEAAAPKATAKAKAGKTKREGLPMVACVTKVMSKSKKGLHIDEVVGGVKKLYNYQGDKGEGGLKNIVYQALYALSQEKARRGWKGSDPVVLHDEENHTWKLNPKAKKIA